MLRRFIMLLAAVAGFGVSASARAAGPLVLAAASLQESMTAAADAWAAKGHERPVVSFAASSALARQVQAGGAADLFASADEKWMDVLEADGRIVPGTRRDFVGNSLVVVGNDADRVRITTRNLASVLASGALAMADPASVPAGLYGKQALTKLGAWSAVASHVVRADNVRGALALVERGAAPYGIVYATDAKASRQVRVVGVFPASSHAPITYPVARLKASANPDAEGFRRFLLSAQGQRIFARYGFTKS